MEDDEMSDMINKEIKDTINSNGPLITVNDLSDEEIRMMDSVSCKGFGQLNSSVDENKCTVVKDFYEFSDLIDQGKI